MTDRLQRLEKEITAIADGILITSETNRRYYTGFPSSAGILLVIPGNTVFFTDSRYIELAKKRISVCQVEELKKRQEQLDAVIRRTGIKTLAVETNHLTVTEFQTLQKNHPTVIFQEDARGDEIIRSQRMVKLPEEVEAIRKAQAIAEKGFSHLLKLLRPGLTEKEIQLELDYFMLKNGAEALSFDTIAVAGPNSSLPHGVPTDYQLQQGDFLTLDFGAVVDGYHSDMTRTVAIGAVDELKKEVYEIVMAAQLAAIAAIRPGITAKDADAAAREVIGEAGYGDCFGHGTGHGVGLEIHEAPNLSQSSTQVLEKGMIVTVEPGIYLPSRFGVRIEDMVLVTEKGCENLTGAEKKLISLG